MHSVDSRRHTLLLAVDAAGLGQAAALLRAGGLVAFPTETVYGLGANALAAEAVKGIFVAKRRPSEDPVIVHLAAAADIEQVARLTPQGYALASRFWPGPLTLILPRLDVVPLEVTAGLDTVAVRVPAHPLAHALLESAGLPIAAPSANLFGRPSPTRPEHVLADLAGRIDAVLDGGATTVGVESTIVDVSGGRPRLLRPGGLPAEAIEAVLGVTLEPPPRRTRSGAQVAPGLLTVHYAPRTPLTLIVGEPGAARALLAAEVSAALAAGLRVGVLMLREDLPPLSEPRPDVRVELVGSWDEPESSAARLYEAVRALDDGGLDVLYARDLAEPTRGLGRALADRLRRAAHHIIEATAATASAQPLDAQH
jgi:L-threonylcarbamoyladenylate synthase